MKKVVLITSSLFLILTSLTSLHAADQDNCLMCHKYSGMGRYENGTDGRGRKRIFYVNEDIFKKTVHGRLRCKSCHTSVNKIPHTGVKKVNCAQNCHIEDPSSGREFSHERIAEALEKSIHGIKGTKHPEYKDDLPTCTYCHDNPINTVSGPQLSFVKICRQCHEKEEWARWFLKHQFYRTTKRRPSKDVVTLCSSCHQNSIMMSRHGLDVAVGFRDTYHGKAIAYGNEDVANCLNCHAPRGQGFTPHTIVSKTNPRSSVNAFNRQKTCQNYGWTGGCHPGATKEFALGREKIHASGVNVFKKAGLYGIASASTGKTNLPSTKRKSQKEDRRSSKDIFHAKVVFWINTGYKIAIAMIIGWMILHQMLDFIAIARERRRKGYGV